MKINQFKKEICPFCDSEMKIERVERINKIDAVLCYTCECSWEETVSIDLRKVNIDNLMNEVKYING